MSNIKGSIYTNQETSLIGFFVFVDPAQCIQQDNRPLICFFFFLMQLSRKESDVHRAILISIALRYSTHCLISTRLIIMPLNYLGVMSQKRYKEIKKS
jgi:hypothetical protein